MRDCKVEGGTKSVHCTLWCYLRANCVLHPALDGGRSSRTRVIAGIQKHFWSVGSSVMLLVRFQRLLNGDSFFLSLY